MAEVLIALIGAIAILYLGSEPYKFAIILLALLLILPGVYSITKGAPFVRTRKNQIPTILKFASSKKGETIIELGCGYGQIIRKIAEKNPANAIGYEFSLPIYLIAKIRSLLSQNRARIEFRNFWSQDYSKADTLICFLMKATMLEFEKKIWPKLKGGTKVISTAFKMEKVEAKKQENGIILYLKSN